MRVGRQRCIVALCCALHAVQAASTYADGLYEIHPLSESDVLGLYVTIVREACNYADAAWHSWPVEPDGGYWGNGISTGNEGIRANGSMIVSCAVLLRYCDTLTEAERHNYLNKAKGALRYVLTTHVTGPNTCVDGLKWGGDWQSPLWASSIALGSWLIWDSLDSDLRQGVETVLAYEADRFLAGTIPSGMVGDTKAEENGWTLCCLSMAANMFASHPHAPAWDQRAREYMMNVISVAQDEQDDTLLDGRPVRDWVCTQNVYPDFTIENHWVFHPTYAGCFARLPETLNHTTLAGRPAPQTASHHVLDVWRMFQTMILPTGELAYPQGMDWELHNLPPLGVYASMAVHQQDPVAAEKEKTLLQYVRTWQQWNGGSLTLPGSTLGFCRHALTAEGISQAYLTHRLHGSATQNAPVHESFVKHFGYVDVTLHRTSSKFVSFSWKNRFMGLIVPTGSGHEDNPFFTVPITNGLVGSNTLTTGTTSTTLLARALSPSPNGFETTGTLLTNGGLLKQTIRVSSVGEKVLVYQDRIVATSDVTIKSELGVPVGIENDSLTGGTRTVSYEGGQRIFDWMSPLATTQIPGSWANVDGRLGMVNVMGSGLAYSQATGYSAGIAVYTDKLYGSYSAARRSFKSGEQVARRIAILAAEVTPAQTAALAQSVRIETGASGEVLRFSLPEGGEAAVSTSLSLPQIAPNAPLSVVLGEAAAFTFGEPSGSVAWQVIDESGPPGTVGSIDSTGLFTGVGLGTCRVKATDDMGNTGVSGLITVIPAGAYSYASDPSTVALYHFDEATGNTWSDFSSNGINATSSSLYPVSHVRGVFGNAAGEFGWDNSAASFVTTGSSTKFQNAEMTAECWVYFPPGIDIPAATADGSIRGILGCRLGGNSWSLCAGSWPNGANPPYGVPGGVCFAYWGTPASEFVYSNSRVFYNDVWYHVAATYRPLGTTPETYEVNLYVTPQGATTPTLVAHKVSPNRMNYEAASGLHIGNESTNPGRKFAGYIDEVRISSKARTIDELKWTLGGISAPALTIGRAKRDAADGVAVSLSGVISANTLVCSYLQATDRSAGIRLEPSPLIGFRVGDVATVVGKLATAGGERRLIPLHAEKVGLPTTLRPIAMSNRSAGGGAFGFQPGASDAVGLNTFGLLVRVWGKCTSAGSDARGAYFVIDDGSRVGVRVYYAGTIDPTNRLVATTGILVPVNDVPSHTARGILPTTEIQILH